MRIERFYTENRDVKNNIVKVRITAFSKEDAQRAADLLSKGWNHHQLRKVHSVVSHFNQKYPAPSVYCLMLWNDPEDPQQ